MTKTIQKRHVEVYHMVSEVLKPLCGFLKDSACVHLIVRVSAWFAQYRSVTGVSVTSPEMLRVLVDVARLKTLTAR